ncbi:ribbon-helix-helix domain-containing protein [bacterium]|nr:ribbon-helix-helix domain-containing protein [bacterium]
MNVRINVTLPESTVRMLDRVAPKGERSALIDAAVRQYVEKKGRATLRKLLKEGAIVHAKRDLEIAEEWASLDTDER